jgi:putative endonuclease
VEAMGNGWYVYMVCCKDNSLYTGISNNVVRRVAEHNSHKTGAKYTKSRRPVRLVYYEKAQSRSEALKREYEIKKQPAVAKRALVNSFTYGVL